jgi:hypothetical protein
VLEQALRLKINLSGKNGLKKQIIKKRRVV